jgi:hypothetical protein
MLLSAGRAIERAWARAIDRFWVHTCTHDHPGALAFYLRTGSGPRGHAGRHIPIIAGQPDHHRPSRRRAVRNGDTDASSPRRKAVLLLQLILIPILFVVQELTVRLGIVSGKGHGELIREHFGPRWAWISVGALVLAVHRSAA